MNYRKYLTEDVLPFWIKNAIDYTYGGIFAMIDKYGNIKDESKNIWAAGRALWTFATAYNLIEKKDEYLDACEKIYSFFDKCVLPDGRLPYLTDKNGKMTEKKNLFHGEVHAAMGCAAYYRACKREDVKKAALRFFDIVYSMYKSGVGRLDVTGGKKSYVFGRDMFILSFVQALRSGGINDARIDELADECVKNIRDTGYINDSSKTVREYVSFEPSGENDNTYSCIGHLYETAWFVMCEGEFKKNGSIKNLGKKILDYALTEEENKDIKAVRLANTSEYDKYLWWPQCEAVIAYYLAYNIFKDEAYLTKAKAIEKFAFESFADRENGEWYSICSKTGDVLCDEKGSLIKGAFHLPRMLIVLASLSENGNISNYIS